MRRIVKSPDMALLATMLKRDPLSTSHQLEAIFFQKAVLVVLVRTHLIPVEVSTERVIGSQKISISVVDFRPTVFDLYRRVGGDFTILYTAHFWGVGSKVIVRVNESSLRCVCSHVT